MCVCVCVHASGGWEVRKESYLCEIEDVCVRDRRQSIDERHGRCRSAGGVSHEGLPTGLRQTMFMMAAIHKGQVSTLTQDPPTQQKETKWETGKGENTCTLDGGVPFPAGYMHSVQGNNFIRVFISGQLLRGM